MKINLEKIEELYGNSLLIEIKNNLEDIVENINYLKKRQINNYEELLENYPFVLIISPTTFQKKIDKLIENLGNNYIEILENNISLWGDIQ